MTTHATALEAPAPKKVPRTPRLVTANWTDTWSASPQPDWGPDFFAAAGIPRSLRDQTIRQTARVS